MRKEYCRWAIPRLPGALFLQEARISFYVIQALLMITFLCFLLAKVSLSDLPCVGTRNTRHLNWWREWEKPQVSTHGKQSLCGLLLR